MVNGLTPPRVGTFGGSNTAGVSNWRNVNRLAGSLRISILRSGYFPVSVFGCTSPSLTPAPCPSCCALCGNSPVAAKPGLSGFDRSFASSSAFGCEFVGIFCSWMKLSGLKVGNSLNHAANPVPHFRDSIVQCLLPESCETKRARGRIHPRALGAAGRSRVSR